jgi:acylphosphatase
LVYGTCVPDARRRVVAQGNVQGVFFRDATRREAERRGVAGWARNTPEGTVEAVFEGSQDAVEAMVDFVRHDPGHSDVRDVEVFDEEPEGLSGFESR